MLAYPQEPSRSTIPPAEQFSPWSLDSSRKIIFTTLPHGASEAVAKLRELVTLITPERYAWHAQA